MPIFFLPDRRVVAIVQGTQNSIVGYAFRDATDMAYVYMFPNASMRAEMTLSLAPAPWHLVGSYTQWLNAIRTLPFPVSPPLAMYGSGQTVAGPPSPWLAALDNARAEEGTSSRADVNTCHDDGWYRIECVATNGTATTVGWLAAARSTATQTAPDPDIREGCRMLTGYGNGLTNWQNVGYRFKYEAAVLPDFSQLTGVAATFGAVFNTTLDYKNTRP